MNFDFFDYKQYLRQRDFQIFAVIAIVGIAGISGYYLYNWRQSKIQRFAQKTFSESMEVYKNALSLDFSKEMTSIRSSRFSISLNMPSYKMITTDLRQLGTYICEMYPPGRIDRVNGLAFSKLHLLELKPYLGEVFRHRPFITVKEENPITGLSQNHGGLMSEFSWGLPSPLIRKNYEKLKKEFRKMSSERKATVKEDRKVKDTVGKRSVVELVEMLKEKRPGFNLKDIKGSGIAALLGIGKDKANTVRSYILSMD